MQAGFGGMSYCAEKMCTSGQWKKRLKTWRSLSVRQTALRLWPWLEDSSSTHLLSPTDTTSIHQGETESRPFQTVQYLKSTAKCSTYSTSMSASASNSVFFRSRVMHTIMQYSIALHVRPLCLYREEYQLMVTPASSHCCVHLCHVHLCRHRSAVWWIVCMLVK